MKSETKKLPKGQSYPLKPSVLAAALADAGVDIDIHFIRSPGGLFDAHFWPPTANVQHERLYLRAGSVSAERAADARQHAEQVMVPCLVRWITEILSMDVRSPVRSEQQAINLGCP